MPPARREGTALSPKMSEPGGEELEPEPAPSHPDIHYLQRERERIEQEKEGRE